MVRLVYDDIYFRLMIFPLTFSSFIFQKLILTDPMLTNEMKRHDEIVALKAYYGDLEIDCFLGVARSSVLNVCKDLENIPRVPIQ